MATPDGETFGCYEDVGKSVLNGNARPRKNRPVEVVADIGVVSLSNGDYCIVDSWVADAVGKVAWQSHDFGYGRTRVRMPNGTFRNMYLHHFVLFLSGATIKDGMVVDHVNRDTRDNRASNLRVVSQSQNLRNRKSVASSGHAGIYQSGSKWEVRYKNAGKNHYVGAYSTIEEAINARKAYTKDVENV